VHKGPAFGSSSMPTLKGSGDGGRGGSFPQPASAAVSAIDPLSGQVRPSNLQAPIMRVPNEMNMSNQYSTDCIHPNPFDCLQQAAVDLGRTGCDVTE
jgi:hypothetical protein